MKRIKQLAAIAVIGFCLGWAIGCAPSATPPATALAPGYSSQADQTLGQTLAAAHTFYTTIQNDIQQGTYKPSPGEVTGLNKFADALNVAQAAYLVYHSNPTSANLATAQTAVNTVSTQQAQLTASITQGVK